MCPYNALVDTIVTGFDISEAWVIALLTMPHIVYAPFSIVVSWMFKSMKAVNVFRFAAIFMLITGWCRLLAFTYGPQYFVLFLSNTCFSFASTIVFNGLSIVVLSWFKENETATATAVMGFGA